MGELEELHLKLRAAVADELPAAIALRHRLHADPRISGDEADTTVEVVRALDAGPGHEVAGTGRIVRIGDDGPGVALRAELDALPVVERTGVPWASRGDAMHACGHDVHLAALVAVGRAAERIGVDVPILAVLQPREESSPSGAEDIVHSGVLAAHDVRAIVAAHLQPRLPDGVVAVTPGPVNAATDEFEVTVTGVGGHAGYPHIARDPVLALCQIVVSLQQIASRRFDPVSGAVCSVGQIAGGSAVNVVPETASARGASGQVRVLVGGRVGAGGRTWVVRLSGRPGAGLADRSGAGGWTAGAGGWTWVVLVGGQGKCRSGDGLGLIKEACSRTGWLLVWREFGCQFTNSFTERNPRPGEVRRGDLRDPQRLRPDPQCVVGG
jgi:hypothetical protein